MIFDISFIASGRPTVPPTKTPTKPPVTRPVTTQPPTQKPDGGFKRTFLGKGTNSPFREFA